MEDINKILELASSNNVDLHDTYNKKLFKSLDGNYETENIAFAEIVIASLNIRNSHTVPSDCNIIDEDWWEIVLYFRPLAQLFAKVNDIAVEQWNGKFEKTVVDFLNYKINNNTLEVK